MEAQLYLRLHYQTSVTATVPTSVISQCYPSARINREPNPKSPLILSHRQSTIEPTHHQVNLHHKVENQPHPHSYYFIQGYSLQQTIMLKGIFSSGNSHGLPKHSHKCHRPEQTPGNPTCLAIESHHSSFMFHFSYKELH